ncbi:MAG TPA: hypothetical protein DCQ26_18415 [Marinilabiliales bacterium]|nr:MAG: hypothetical protein A2W95_06335 [Bacteroidetes bacterium GWA2_40_14]OFX59495.1 MAG: hypothetical protein A2W84_19155 [Bacteroidetes bacterium GWC2_40_13]OFX75564.1 MAG: hypothetical protein A2W96_08760 [Bacteroidetes bacterium GWD2_40_43]OFX90718.1 MAG: hypothetical protein A2W97_03035 [Bacteroidetes bacterium GWE2_40_63]OFY20804.1 MAG: hypothetical protein A2W88_17230 [Bacteroidetes bacterium GWF2_40_13]OFZ23775.1 MAG: hypothetical protein A2437_07025 [Bacteroidetes bacterium RIFOXYC
MKKSTRTWVLQLLSFLILPLGLFAQNASITGKVIDKNGEPLIGVNLMIKGTTIGTVSDLDGNYTISGVPNQSVEVVASFIGYTNLTKQLDLTNAKTATLNFTLLEDIAELSEVVVIGYGTQKKSDLTSSVAVVNAEDIEQSRATNIQEALQGRTAGVKVLNNSGAAGSGVKVEIRGITSINGTDPVWVVDGIISDPRSVNANDILSMSILKDASSTAIYGSQGAGGVVLITTKKGEAGKTKVSFNAWGGVSNIVKTLDMASGPEFAKTYHEWEVLAKKRKYFFSNPDTLPTYDYQDKIFRQATTQSYDLGVTGGSEKSTFYMGVGYQNQHGILKNNDYKKLTARINSEHKANKWLTIGENFSFNQQQTSGFEEWELFNEYATPILQAIQYHSFVEPYGDKLTESEYDEGWSFTPLGNTANPLSTIALKHRENTSNAISGTLFAKIAPFEGLTFETRVNGNLGFSNSYNFTPIYYITSSLKNSNSKIARDSYRNKGWNIQNLLTYNKTLFDVHNISLLAGFESKYGKSEWESGERWDLINQSPEMWYFNASTNDTLLAQLPSGGASEGSEYSYLGRISYDYKGLILTQFNMRKDYSSKFGPQNRYGYFPSFSAGFKFSELDIVRNTLPFMNFGKIRAGWGKIGNSVIPENVYYPTVAFENVYMYSFTNLSSSATGAGPNKMPNYEVGWEGVVTTNLALDLQFFDSKLSITTELFNKHNDEMLMETPVAYWAGYIVRDIWHEGGTGNPILNVGRLTTKGVEAAIGWKEQRGDFRYEANGNFTYLKTQTGAISPDTLLAGGIKGINGYLTKTIEGQPVGDYYGYIADGIFRLSDMPNADGIVTNQPYTLVDGDTIYAQPKAQPGDIRFRDVNGDGKLDNSDIVPIGNPNPKFLFGLNLNLEYGNPNMGYVDMSLFMQGTIGNKIFNAVKFYQCNTDGAFNWSSDYANDHYTVELVDRNGEIASVANDNAKYPRIDPKGDNENFTTLSSFYIEDGSYLRLKNIEIGYTAPEKITKIVDIEKFRVFFGAKNLLTFTKYSGMDPEIGSTGVLVRGLDQAAYPQSRMYTIGINVTF